jgi:hypothetical protein
MRTALGILRKRRWIDINNAQTIGPSTIISAAFTGWIQRD